MEQAQEQLSQIKTMMERSSRMISLSGLSGIAAGVCALVGAGFAYSFINKFVGGYDTEYVSPITLSNQLQAVAVLTLLAALIVSFLFTWRKSKKDGVPLFGMASKRLLWNTILPMACGALLCVMFMLRRDYIYVAPCLLMFYGLGLVNGSKYTLGEVRYLGYINIILGCIDLFFPRYSLLFWTLGFGVAHIIYGALMWYRYERKN
jgi:hypothetical protein